MDSDSTVSIVINVVDNNSAPAIQQVETRLASLGAAGTLTGTQIASTTTQMKGFTEAVKQVGTAGAATDAALTALRSQVSQLQAQLASTQAQATQTAAALAALQSASQSSGAGMAQSFTGVRSGIENTRLAAEEMGLRIPRAMQRVIAGNAELGAALSATMGLFIAIGAISIFEQLIQGAVNFYEKWVDIDKAIDDYQQKAGQAAQQKLFDTASVEMTLALLKQINDQIDQLNAKKSAGTGEAIMPVTGFEDMSQYTTADSQATAQAMENAQKLKDHQAALNQQLASERLKSQTSYDDAVNQGYAKISAHEADTEKQINQRYDNEVANQKKLADLAAAAGISVPDIANSFNQQRAQQLAAAQQEAAGQRVALARAESEQIIALQNEAIDAGVKGEALADEQRQQAIDAVTRKYQAGEISKQGAMAETEAIDMKFHNQKMMRLEEEQYQTSKIQQEAQQAGLTGLAKIQAEGQNKVEDLYSNPANASLDDENLQKRRLAYEQETDQQIIAAHTQFTQEINTIDQRGNQFMTQGYAKIEADTERLLGALAGDFERYAGQLNPYNPEDIALIVQGANQVASAVTQIEQNAARERLQLEQQHNEQVAKMEDEAAQLVLPPWEAAQQKIVDEYIQRIQKIQQQVQQQVLTEQEGAQAVTAAWDLANAQMQKQMEQTRDQIAGSLMSMFDNPAAYMKKKAEELMFDIMANWLMQAEKTSPMLQGVFGWLFGKSPEMSTSSNPITALGSVFGIHPSGAQGGETLGIPNNLGTAGIGSAGTTLTSAGTTLSSAGTTLSSSGTMLSSSATQLDSAATALMNAASSMSSTAGAGAGGGGGLLGDLFGSASAGGGGGFQPSDISPTGAGGVFGTPPGGGFGSSTSSLDALGTLAGSSGDITGGAGTLSQIGQEAGGLGGALDHQVWDEQSGMQTGVGSSSLGIAGGIAGAAAGALGVAGAYKQHSPMGMLTGALSGAEMGASIGTMIMPGIGTAIGAAAGAIGGFFVGLFGDLFGDHGRSKMVAYDKNTIYPELTQEMQGFQQGTVGYAQANDALVKMSADAQAEANTFGSGAVSYYSSNIIPEIQAAQATLTRAEKGGRDQISFSAAQFHTGGTISDFGDLWTSQTTGFVHAQLGENVLTPTQMSALATGSSSSPRMAPATSGPAAQINIQAWDGASVDRWLRSGGAQKIQAAVNQNTGRYSGVALGS